MLNKLKKITLQITAGANIGIILLMLFVGYSSLFHPTTHPRLSAVGLTFPIPLVANFLFLIFWLLLKSRYAFIPIIGFIVAYKPVHDYFPINPPHTVPQDAIKVVSYNVAGWGAYLGNHNDSTLHDCAKYILESNADIVCLQEAAWRNVVTDSTLREAYPYVSQDMANAYGDYLAVYSRFPIEKIERILNPRLDAVSYAYYLDIKGMKTMLVNCHLESNRLESEDKKNFTELISGKGEKGLADRESKLLIDKITGAAARRAPQVDTIAKYIASHKAGKEVILLGDFNDNPISYTLHTFGKNLTNCYTAAANGPGFSYNRSRMYVRIDHILCSENLMPYKCFVDRSTKSSDHYPIVCYLKHR